MEAKTFRDQKQKEIDELALNRKKSSLEKFGRKQEEAKDSLARIKLNCALYPQQYFGRELREAKARLAKIELECELYLQQEIGGKIEVRTTQRNNQWSEFLRDQETQKAGIAALKNQKKALLTKDEKLLDQLQFVQEILKILKKKRALRPKEPPLETYVGKSLEAVRADLGVPNGFIIDLLVRADYASFLLATFETLEDKNFQQCKAAVKKFCMLSGADFKQAGLRDRRYSMGEVMAIPTGSTVETIGARLALLLGLSPEP